jgi:quercetin dioxygenase-like cupin family protein
MISSLTPASSDSPYAGVERRTIDTDKATIVEYRFAPGANFPLHHHPQDQITVVLEGQVHLRAGEEERELTAGQWVCTASGESHGITGGEQPSVFLAILVPPRAKGEAPILNNDSDTGAIHDLRGDQSRRR